VLDRSVRSSDLKIGHNRKNLGPGFACQAARSQGVRGEDEEVDVSNH
jgi:hypothetical protein